MSTLHRLSPILWTKDLDQTIAFYTEILKFKAQSRFPDFVSLSNGNVLVMFVQPEEVDDHPPMLTGSLYIYADEVDELWEHLKDKVTVKTPLCDREYLMRDFSILDNNGYELVFGKDISNEKR